MRRPKHFEKDGQNFWPTYSRVNGQRMFEVEEERIARFVMFRLRRAERRPLTSAYLCSWVNSQYSTRIYDKDIRGIIRRMQIQGKPIVSTPYGFAIASKKKIEQQAVRMLKHGWAEVKYARQLLDSRLFDRITGQLKIKVKL